MITLSTFRKSINVFLIGSSALFFTACSQKSDEIQEYNKPAIYWYNKMVKEIAFDDIDAADDAYTSLLSEHKNSPLVPVSLQILANAHIEEEQYLLANYYLDEYIKRFVLSKNIDYVRYLKIKANYLSIPERFREQQLVHDTIDQSEAFMKNYPTSAYMPLVQTINSRLYMAKAALDKEISELYERIDKPVAAQYYNEKVEKNWVDKEEIVPAQIPWYKAIFE